VRGSVFAVRSPPYPGEGISDVVASGPIIRVLTVCERGFCRRYAIAPLPLSGVGALDHRLAGITVLALE